MAEKQHASDVNEEEYSWWEVAYWLIGIVMVPLAPILMITFFTPFSGVGPTGH